MIRRFRLLFALLALLSFSVSFAEAVWASMCPPMEAPASMVGMEEMSGMMSMPGMGMSQPVDGSSGPSENSRDAKDLPECPFMALGTTGCHTLSIPGSGGAPASVDTIQLAAGISPTDRMPDLLLAIALFRPPRA